MFKKETNKLNDINMSKITELLYDITEELKKEGLFPEDEEAVNEILECEKEIVRLKYEFKKLNVRMKIAMLKIYKDKTMSKLTDVNISGDKYSFVLVPEDEMNTN